MAQTVASWFVTALTVYLLIGVVVAIALVARGVQRIDPAAREGSLGFRLAIFPGCVALWPWLLRRWLGGQTTPPAECNAHRDAAAHTS